MKTRNKVLKTIAFMPLSLVAAIVASPFVAVAAFVATIIGFPWSVADCIWKKEESPDGRQQD